MSNEDTTNTGTKDEVIGLLIESIESYYKFDPDGRTSTYRELKELSLEELLQRLTKFERSPGLPAELHGLTAAAKQALIDPTKWEAFFIRAMKVQGQM